MNTTQPFLYTRSRYYGPLNPQHLIFDANLQEFAQRVSYISCLQNGGKLTAQEAFNEIEMLWQKLHHSREQLAIGG